MESAIEDNSLHYQSFSASYKLENSISTMCNCNYCLTVSPSDVSEPISLSQIPEMELMDDDNKLIKNYETFQGSHRNKENTKKKMVVDNFYDLWQSEKFKAKAFEKDNDKLENRIKYLENKLEKEAQQQIKISLEWRKQVVNLIDENRKLKLIIESHKSKQFESFN